MRLEARLLHVPHTHTGLFSAASQAHLAPLPLSPSSSQVGIKGIETNQGNVTSWAYGNAGGGLPFGPTDMPQVN